jgi:hypothetical protein
MFVGVTTLEYSITKDLIKERSEYSLVRDSTRLINLCYLKGPKSVLRKTMYTRFLGKCV